MIHRVYIGPTVVQVHDAQALPPELRGLLRASAPGLTHTVSLHIVPVDAPAWAMDIVQQGDTHIFGRPRHAIEISPAAQTMRLLLCPGLNFDDLYWIQRDIFGALACVSGGVMLHASAVRGPDDRAYVFCGQSGVGKSTLARLLQQRRLQVISDEVNWLVQDEEGPLRLVNQPFWMNESAEPALPVGGLYLLRQGTACTLGPAGPMAEVFSKLLSMHLSIDDTHDFLRQRAEALSRLVQAHPVQTLEFNLDTGALWGLLWKTPR